MDILLLDAEQRVLGALLEKELATPDHYPLSLNSLLNACNQKSSRDPVVEYDDTTVLRVIAELKGRSFVRSTNLGRVVKYEQCFTDRFNLLRSESALLAVLLLRGPQTPGELRNRTSRMASFDSVEMLLERLQSLVDAGLIKQLSRNPGQKESRFCHLLGGEPELSGSLQGATAATVVVRRSTSMPAKAEAETTIGERVGILENTVQRLEDELEQLRGDLIRFREEFE
ncbi:MAG: YceH family protein [Proteobacteria bacterium]|nr:YceH family protein [Pseudomonadota bacterium]MBU1138808.1 YceH family protein [Pseudomonadota bacterium]MBU1231807.1 YceH family protein [Pseudomonadota bacterium]MBU1419998.1 YceH family protein [Pseudomonadota bacterium]MBU1454781.1 YceH family protein [Pseudomonadota bacterium]